MFIYYTAITALAIFSQIVMLTILKSDNLLPTENKRYFNLAFITFILGTFLEWFSDVIRIYSSVDTFHYTITQAVMHIIIPLTPYYLGCAFKKYENVKPFRVLFALNICLQALSLTPYFENNFHDIFKHGNTYVIYFTFFLYVLYKMFINIYQVSIAYQSANITPLIFNIFFITNFAIVLQSLVDGINTIFITNTVNSILMYAYYSALINKRDGLTSLLNRRCFENRIKNFKSNKVFLFIDLNKFKEINDTHGHLVGDQVLKEIAAICLETFGHYGSAYRIGGDEYCIVIKKHLDDVETLIATLHQNIDKKRGENPLLPSVSVGYGYFVRNKNTVNDAINEADDMMYKIKNKHKIAELKI